MIDHQKRWALSYLFRSDWSLVGPPKLLNDSRVTPDVLLATDEDDGETTAEVLDLGDPLKCNLSHETKDKGGLRKRTFSCTLSKESGESTAKQMRMTWESG